MNKTININKYIILLSAALMLFSYTSLAQKDSGFKGKNTPKTNNSTPESPKIIKNKWAEATVDSIKSDTTAHVFGSYNFRDDRNIPWRAKRQIHKGDLYFSLGSGKYDKAMYHYKKAFRFDPEVAYVDYKIGQCYLLMRSAKFKSILYLEKAYHQNKHVSKDIHYYLGRAYHVNNDFVKAIDEYNKSKSEYRKAHRNDHISEQEKKEHLDLIEKSIEECKSAMLLKSEPVKAMVENMRDSINSPYPDYDPFITSDESMMIFTSRRYNTRGRGKADIDHVFYEDLFVSHNENGLWTNARPMVNRFNKRTNDAIIGLSHDGKNMFVYRDTKNGDIYLCALNDGSWTKPKAIKEINTSFHESSACFSFDKSVIYYVSDQPGGFGGRDIYKVEKQQDGTWGLPQNLGGIINTKYDEERVYMHPNGKILYFCSKGHNSMGGYDVFYSEMDETGNWPAPVNLGYPINSSDDDISFVTTANGDRGYFSTYRPKGSGDRDIYLIRFGISDKMGTLNKEDELLSKRKIAKDDFVSELIKVGIEPLGEGDEEIILPQETLAHLDEMITTTEDEIQQLLALKDSATNKKEILQLEQQIAEKQNELTLLQDASSSKDLVSLESQVMLRKDEVAHLQEQLDSTKSKKEIKKLNAQIAAKQNELSLLQSVYVASVDSAVVQENLLTDQSAITLNDSAMVVANNSFNLQDSLISENAQISGDSINVPTEVNNEETIKGQVGLIISDSAKVVVNNNINLLEELTSDNQPVDDTVSETPVQISSPDDQVPATNNTLSQVAESDDIILNDDNISPKIAIDDAPLFLIVQEDGKMMIITEDQLDKKSNEISSEITKENVAINNLKLKIAMESDEEKIVAMQQEVAEKENNVKQLRKELNTTMDAVHIETALNNDVFSKDQINDISNAVEKIKLELSANQNMETVQAYIEDSSLVSLPDKPIQQQQSDVLNNNIAETTNDVAEPIENNETKANASGNESKASTASSENTLSEENIASGNNIILENILFDFDKATLRPESYETLDQLIEILKNPPTTKAEFSGHTDNKGSDSYNQLLSEKRAKAVVDYLVKNGISEERLRIMGYGEARPIAPNSYPDGSDNPAGRQLNRRTELKILK